MFTGKIPDDHGSHYASKYRGHVGNRAQGGFFVPFPPGQLYGTF